MVAQLTPPKGWGDFIECIGRLVAMNADVKGVIVGDGPLRAAIERDVRSRGLEAHVTLVGHTDNVAETLHALDIFLLTSHREGLSVAVLEAMASGLPIVATDVGGTREQIIDNVNGFIVQKGDIDAMVDRVLRLINSRKLRGQFGDASRARAETLFSQDRMVSMYAALYRSAEVAVA
jgi:glycosyltransferase involved in cell wall biosynthesis